MELYQYLEYHSFSLFHSFKHDNSSVASGNAWQSVATLNSSKLPSCFYTCSDIDGWSLLSQKYSDLPPCFVQAFLLGFLSLLAIFGGFQQVRTLYHRKVTITTKVSGVQCLKLALVITQIVFQTVLIINYPIKDLIGTVLELNLVGLVVVLGLHYLEIFKSSIPNGVLLFYWLFSIIFNMLKLVNISLRTTISTTTGLFTLFSFVNAGLILTAELSIPMKSNLSFSELSKISPYDRANVFSRLTFLWMGGLIKNGYHKFLTEKDLPPLPFDLRCKNTTDNFYKNWYGQKTTHPHIIKALVKTYGPIFSLGALFKGCQDILAYVQPQLLKLLIIFVNDYSESKKQGDPIPLTKGFMIAGSMFAVSVTQTAFVHQYFQVAFDTGMKIKSSMTSVIYNKSLVLSNDSKQESTTGDIVNLMSVDVQRLQELCQYVQMGWSGPFQLTLCLVSLYKLLGNAMWAGVAIMVIMIPLNGALARTQKNLQITQMRYKDERTRLTSEILNNIKSLKLYAWEEPYLAKLNHVRNDKELKNLQKIGIFAGCMVLLWNFAPTMVSCFTFGLYILLNKDKTLSTDVVFPALALFNLLGFPLAVIPQVISNVIEAQVSIGRLHKFLHGSDVQSDAVVRLPSVANVGDVAVKLSDATFLWNKSKDEANSKVALSAINLSAKKGELTCIVGKVGSGKSSIIQAMLGDLYKLDGTAEVHGSIAYVAQVPWIMNGSIKDNILFGHKYDPEFYQHVLKACALTVDLGILPKRDETLVGEKGISLSGGQKARLSLARAVYARSDVYLIDDALSAVDEHVGKHLIDHVLGPNGLLSTKTKILATNNINILSIAHSIHMIADGFIVEQGSLNEIMTKTDSKLYSLITEFGKEKEKEPITEENKEGEVHPEQEIDYSNLDSEDDISVKSLRRASVVSLNDELAEFLDKQDDDEEVIKRKEHFEQGKVKWDNYIAYAKACNPVMVCVWLSNVVLSMAANIGLNIWLKHWSEVNTAAGYNPRVVYYLGVYIGIGVFVSLLIFTQNVIQWFYCAINGSKVLHTSMAQSVLRAPMSFFETTPIGRILNRFSNDVYKVDDNLCRVFSMFFSNSTKAVFAITVICVSTWPVLFLIVPLFVVYAYYQQYYLRSSRELRRLDSVSRSPIFANFQESLNGVSTIRAYGQEERFRYLNELRVDKNMQAYNPAINSNRWLAVRLEFIGSIIILGAAGFAIFGLRYSNVSAGMVGLSVSYALQITQTLNWIVRMTVEVETNIVSVERILEYSKLPSEAPNVIEDKRPANNWPQQGQIEFDDYSTRYRPELDLVLKNISLSIKAHEKVGIVGRTGAGKSSLTLALFRIIEAANGNIDIDALNTSTIGLKDLRQKLSIIPQDSQVFEGSIRANLDPFGYYTEDQLWKALELSHLKELTLKMFEEQKAEAESSEKDKEPITSPLDVQLNEGGCNLSVGQRQLICLARALLIPSHILVLDEATAAVDVETDKVLQETIRKEFKDRTILTIAHRINTILDSDKIIVLDKGEVAEFDSPENLLKKKESLFYSLCKQAGFVKE